MAAERAGLASLQRALVEERRRQARLQLQVDQLDLGSGVPSPPLVRMQYAGIWRESVVYAAGATVTDHGALWYTAGKTASRPPGGSWTLCAKSTGGGKAAR